MEPKGTFKVRLDVPDQYHDALRKLAAEAGGSMASLVRAMVVSACEGEETIRVKDINLRKPKKVTPPAPPPRPRGRPRKPKDTTQ